MQLKTDTLAPAPFSQFQYKMEGSITNHDFVVLPTRSSLDELFGAWQEEPAPCFDTYCYFLRMLCGYEQTPTCLYRYYADDGGLLYVGVSNNPEYRDNEHMKKAGDGMRAQSSLSISRTGF